MIRVGSLSTPRLFSALPPVNIYEASPKAISGRTSYIRVRLEFLRYPQVIRQLFNGGRFGPPLSFTSTSTCSWIGHPVSGLMYATLVLFTLGFPAAPILNILTSLHTLTRRTVLQKVPHHPHTGLCVLVSIRFQVLFHSPPGVLFTFPSQYFSTIGHQVVFRLGGWSPHLLTGFHVPADTLDSVSLLSISPTSLSLSPDRFPKTIRLSSAVPCTVHTP